MADAKTTEAPKARRKPQGPRKERPTFAVITVRDESGNAIPLTADRVSVKLTKDTVELLKIVTGPERDLNALVIQAESSGPAPSPASTASQGADTQAG